MGSGATHVWVVLRPVERKREEEKRQKRRKVRTEFKAHQP